MENNQNGTGQLELAKKLNANVFTVIGSENKLIGFEKAYLIANAAKELKLLLTAEYMKPIMELQGNRLGFKTDKDKAEGISGYPEAVVKNCLIEAVLTGVQPFGNQFNIIAGNCYITKEGFGYLLANYKGLSYEIIPALPRIKDGSAAIVMNIKWSLNGQSNERAIDIPVKVNQYMGTDAVIGKATRKARAWLYNTITGSEVADGDAYDNDAPRTIIIESVIDKEAERINLLLADCVTVAEVKDLAKANPGIDVKLFEERENELISGVEAEAVAEFEAKEKPTEEMFFAITTCETIPQLNQLVDSNPQFKDNLEFNSAINKRKMAIGKPLQKKSA